MSSSRGCESWSSLYLSAFSLLIEQCSRPSKGRPSGHLWAVLLTTCNTQHKEKVQQQLQHSIHSTYIKTRGSLKAAQGDSESEAAIMSSSSLEATVSAYHQVIHELYNWLQVVAKTKKRSNIRPVIANTHIGSGLKKLESNLRKLLFGTYSEEQEHQQRFKIMALCITQCRTPWVSRQPPKSDLNPAFLDQIAYTTTWSGIIYSNQHEVGKKT